MTMSAAARAAFAAQQTSEALLTLLTIDHPDLATPLRHVDDWQAIDSRGATYLPYAFEVTLPEDDGEQMGEARLVIDNVSREITATLRALGSPPTVIIEAVTAGTPDMVEAGPYEMTLKMAPGDLTKIEGVLGYEPILDEPFPGDSFTPNLFPGLFR